jgi:hypothetical protein
VDGPRLVIGFLSSRFESTDKDFRSHMICRTLWLLALPFSLKIGMDVVGSGSSIMFRSVNVNIYGFFYHNYGII